MFLQILWEDGLKGDPLGQNLAVDRKEQGDPIRDCFLYSVGPWHSQPLDPVEQLAPVCYKE